MGGWDKDKDPPPNSNLSKYTILSEETRLSRNSSKSNWFLDKTEFDLNEFYCICSSKHVLFWDRSITHINGE